MQPRHGQGYMTVGQMGILNSLGLLAISDDKIAGMISHLRKRKDFIDMKVPAINNQAKQIATQLYQKCVQIIGGGFLEGAIHALRNTFHETSKNFADYFLLPEANHHLMEGLKFPSSNPDNLVFLMIKSSLYSQRIQQRYYLTKEVISNNGIEVVEINLTPTDKLTQNFELLQLGNYIIFYLSMLYGLDPSKIPWVDYFKENLGKQ